MLAESCYVMLCYEDNPNHKQIQIQIQIESLHTRLDETDEMTNTGVVPAGPFLGARTTRAPRDAGGPPFVLSARAEPRIKGGELQ